jgi:hypothetical protein
MATESTGGFTGPSPFNRPPQPRISPAASTPARVATPGLSTLPGAERSALEGQRRSGGQWFYWIAALSSVNAVLALAGQQWRFILGLGATQLVQEIAAEAGGAGIKAGLISFAVIGFFAFLGKRAIQGHCWAFVVGMVSYGLDGLIFLLIQDWVGVGFHAFAVAMITRGYLAARQLPPPNA